MAYLARNRVKETTATTGTGPLTLAGAVPRFRRFATAGVTAGSTFSYAIEVPSGPWEVGLGTMQGNGTVARVLEDSSTGALLALTGEAGTTVSLVAAATTFGRMLAGGPASPAASLADVAIPLVDGSILTGAALLALLGLTAPAVSIPATTPAAIGTLRDDYGSALADDYGSHLIEG